MSGNGIFDYSNVPYTSSSDSSDDEIEVKLPEEPVRYLIPAPPSSEIQETKAENHQNTETDGKTQVLMNKLIFYEQELSRLNNLLASSFDPHKRRRSTFQYGCRTCGRFPKRSACICTKNRTKKLKKSESNEVSPL